MVKSITKSGSRSFRILRKSPIVEAIFQVNFAMKRSMADVDAKSFVKAFSSGGRYGKDILEAIQATERSLQNTQTFGLRNRILGILHSELQRKYGINGWNGYGAKAVDQESIRHAEAFVKVMPFELKEPAVRVVPSGCVSFSWREGKGRLCTVVFDTDGKYHCASIIGAAESAITTNSPDEVIGKAMEVFA